MDNQRIPPSKRPSVKELPTGDSWAVIDRGEELLARAKVIGETIAKRCSRTVNGNGSEKWSRRPPASLG